MYCRKTHLPNTTQPANSQQRNKRETVPSAVECIHQTVTKQSAGTVGKQSAGIVSKQASKCDYPAIACTLQLCATNNWLLRLLMLLSVTTTAATPFPRLPFPPPPLCAVAADTAAEPDRAPSLPPLLAAAGTAVAAEPPCLLLLPSEERKGVRVCACV